MKKGFLRNVLDTIRSNQTNQQTGGSTGGAQSARTADYGGQLKTQHFALSQVARHGFPEQPTALAYDPVQRLAAIGTKSGALRIFGRPGVDIWAQHKPQYAITHIRFVVNQGAIITVTSDESIHLWSLRGPNLKLQLSSSSSSSSCSPPAPGSSPAPGAQAAATSHHHTTASQHHLDSGAQPGDPDYHLSSGSGGVGGEQVTGGSSPTGFDKSGGGGAGNRRQYSKQPQILHTLKFQREHITCLHQTLMSKWLYIGTERGNVHVANVETFELSGYSIAWNKAIELSRKTHPGAIIQLCECPQDSNKLLIGYESGCIVLWDLKGRNAEGRYYNSENLLWLSWHYEGKQFVASHGDGSLVTWQTRSNARPAQILQPHAKVSTTSANPMEQQWSGAGSGAAANESSSVAAYLSGNQQQLPPTGSSSSFARALNNELYRPINKVEWKTSKSNEQFLLFSGGLPFDGLTDHHQQQQPPGHHDLTNTCPTTQQQQQQQQQQFLKATAASPSTSISPSISPSATHTDCRSRQSSLGQQQQQQAPVTYSAQRSNLKSTSLTVMYGKSITVLEMDDTIIDFITICDSSPYENDASDPYAVIVLLSNDLILIDLTSSGYPSFDSPYPSSLLNESPITCVQYLADCSSDLIPFLYSNSQNVVSRAPKKGFSDKEWPINGGEWNQPMQSYPELVLTGHADGSIKFWDMSGVNFDLISKIKTSKLFERPSSRLLNLVQSSRLRDEDHQQAQQLVPMDESNCLAVERIEYCASSRHLLVAGASGQVIQFRLNTRREQQSAGAAADVSTVLVEPLATKTSSSSSGSDSNQPPLAGNNHQSTTASSASAATTTATTASATASLSTTTSSPPTRQHLLLKTRTQAPTGASSSSGGSSSSASSSQRNRLSGFHAELICLTPALIRPLESGAAAAVAATSTSGGAVYLCQAPPKVTALTFQSAHSILAFAHELGIVLIDTVQKCVILNATLADLYGGASILNKNRDISIQPFATSSILQHHYQQATSGAVSGSAAADFISGGQVGGARCLSAQQNNGTAADNGGGAASSTSSNATSAAAGAGGSRVAGELVDNGDIDNGFSSFSSSSTTTPQHQQQSKSTIDSTTNLSQSTAQVSASSPSSSSLPPPQQQQSTKDEHDGHHVEVDAADASAHHDDNDQLADLAGQSQQQQTRLPGLQSEQQPAPVPAARAPLAQAKSVAVSETRPVAPPRNRKRQSVPSNRLPTAAAAAAEPVSPMSCEQPVKVSGAEIEPPRQLQRQERQRDLVAIEIDRQATSAPLAEFPNIASTTSAQSGSSGGGTQPIGSTISTLLTKFMVQLKSRQRPLDLEMQRSSSPLLTPGPRGHAHPVSPVPSPTAEGGGLFGGRKRSQLQVQQQQQQHQDTSAAFDEHNKLQSLTSASPHHLQQSANQHHHQQQQQQQQHQHQQQSNGKQLTNSRNQFPPPLQSPPSLRPPPLSTTRLPPPPPTPPSLPLPPPAGLPGLQQPPLVARRQQQLPAAVPAKSRFTTNSLFQRQLSTTALGGGGGGGSGSGRPNTSGSGGGGGGPRLFHRQATASQLNAAPADGLSNKQRAAALLAAARGEPAPATPSSPLTPRKASGATSGGGSKNKRIISRMLSISAIHTTASSATLEPDNESGDPLQRAGQLSEAHPNSAATGNDQAPDKIDSSFTRSRSSSASSTAPNTTTEQQHLGNVNPSSASNQLESIQCLCFLDFAAATAAAQQQQQAPSSSSGGGGVGCNNNRSLGSLDSQSGSQLALYLGTSQGCVLLVSLVMPDSEDNRILQLQSVQADPIPQAAVKLAGSILCIASFTSEPNRQQAPTGGSPCSSLEGSELGSGSTAGATSASSAAAAAVTAATSGSQSGGGGGGSGAGAQGAGARTSATDSSSHSSFDSTLRAATFLALVSEKQVRLYQLPVQAPARTPEHQAPQHHKVGATPEIAPADTPIARFLTNKANCVARAHLSDSSFACRSQLVQMRAPDETCLLSYLASGNLLVHSLPQLRPLLDADLVPYTNARIGSSMQFSRNGHCLYQPSASEICKFTVSAQYKALVNEITGSLYVGREMPEMPRTNFFKSLFSAASSAASRQSERDELFGDAAAGKPSRNVAKHIPSLGNASGGAGLDKLKGAAAGTLGHELRAAREGLDERGEKLGEVEDRTLAMLNQSEGYAQAAHQLAQKFKDKKWYQF